MTTERYTTTAGETIEYPTPEPDVAAFLERVLDAANDPSVTTAELTEFVFAKENPVLDSTLFPGRGAVTKAVFANPIYHVMQDLLFSKRVQREVEPTQVTMSVAEVAAELSMSGSAVRQAIRRGDLDAEQVKGAWAVDASTVATYRDRVTRRGPTASEPALRLRIGNEPGASFRVKVAGLEVDSQQSLENGGRYSDAHVDSFERALVYITGKKMSRLFVLTPSDEQNSFEHGSFKVEGRYSVHEKLNQPAVAAEVWRTARSSGLFLFVVEVEGVERWVAAHGEGSAIELAGGGYVAGPGVHAPPHVREWFAGVEAPTVLGEL